MEGDGGPEQYAKSEPHRYSGLRPLNEPDELGDHGAVAKRPLARIWIMHVLRSIRREIATVCGPQNERKHPTPPS